MQYRNSKNAAILSLIIWIMVTLGSCISFKYREIAIFGSGTIERFIVYASQIIEKTFKTLYLIFQNRPKISKWTQSDPFFIQMLHTFFEKSGEYRKMLLVCKIMRVLFRVNELRHGWTSAQELRHKFWKISLTSA